MSDLIFREWNGRKIRQREDGYISATDMAVACGKLFGDWKRLKETNDYLNTLSSVKGIPITKAVQVFQGGIPEKQGAWVHRKVAIRFAQWLSSEFALIVDDWVEEIILKGKVDLNSQSTTSSVVSIEEMREHRLMLEILNESGDIQLAQLVKNKLGNALLAEQQAALSGSVVEQYEGVVDVAIRLGFSIPKSFESALGRYVTPRCEHLLIGQNDRYSNASAKIIKANMYPKNSQEVETAVKSYCLSKGFRQRNLRLLG